MTKDIKAVAESVCIPRQKSPVRNNAYGQFAPSGLKEFYDSELRRIAQRIVDKHSVNRRLDHLVDFATAINQQLSWSEAKLPSFVSQEMYSAVETAYRFRSFSGFGEIADPAFADFFAKACRAIWVVVDGQSRNVRFDDVSMPNNAPQILFAVVEVFAGEKSVANAYDALVSCLKPEHKPSMEQFQEILERIAVTDTPLTDAWNKAGTDWYCAGDNYAVVLRWHADNIGSHLPPNKELGPFGFAPANPKKQFCAVAVQVRIADVEYADFEQLLNLRGPRDYPWLAVVCKEMIGNSRIEFHSVLDLVEKGKAAIVAFNPPMEKVLHEQHLLRTETKIDGLSAVTEQIASVWSN